MKKKILTIITFLVLIVFSTPSFAYLYTVEKGLGSSSVGVYYYDNNVYDSAYAAIFNLDFFTTDGQSKLFSANAFCVDIEHLAGNGQATLEEISTTDTGMIGAAWLMDTYLPTANSEHDYAALQLAIWTVLYPNNRIVAYDLSAYPISSYPEYTYYGIYLDYMDGYDKADLSNFSAANYRIVDFVDDETQDMLIKNPVPEPTTMLLFGFGLVSLAGIVRKKLLNKR